VTEGEDVMDALGTIGVWTSSRQWPSDPAAIADAAAELERLGFGALWLGSSTADLALPETILGATSSLVVATGVIDIWTNPAHTVGESHRRLRGRFSDRFLLGLGSGHALVAEAAGQKYERPLAALTRYLDEFDAGPDPAPANERVLAALGPKALQLSAARSLGAHTYLVTPEYTASARKVLGPQPLLAPEQKVVLISDPTQARALAREWLALYLQLPNYLNNLRRLGFDDEDLAAGGSDRLVDGVVAWGSSDAITSRVRAHLDAGADHVALQVLSADEPSTLPVAGWRRTAEWLNL
jgi:probable F420-dependent oxidoreductase